MGRPSIKNANIQSSEKVKKSEVEKLTVLEADSNESIYALIFSETEKGGKKYNE